ncbi:probable 28S ribosomal protein S16, mitochondrial [Homarus americanus]|uniref:Small ribosomal subunit protein bS16m n=1 Tax=Homarus americanus TaxID=6706 RepID=A0A8J5TBP2_HOMAM|nr:probable 28S ribosomal protein S16, mitochondrial [Homarus americanus]KAG7173761.1 28S ribosomal protein S16-like [Homarus americanus]
MLFPASGGARFGLRSTKCIRFAKHGCTNRPFFHIVVMEKRKPRQGHVIEQLGTYDPLANAFGEKLCSINLERTSHWIGQGALISNSCAVLLGLSGLLPLHPTSYMLAWRNRKAAEEKSQKEETS